MAGTTDAKEKDLIEHRALRFEELGFDPERSQILALTKGDNGWPLDIHKVKRAIIAGCDLETAWTIFSPL